MWTGLFKSLRKPGKQDLEKLIKWEIIYMICVLLETSGKDAKNQTGYHSVINNTLLSLWESDREVAVQNKLMSNEISILFFFEFSLKKCCLSASFHTCSDTRAVWYKHSLRSSKNWSMCWSSQFFQDKSFLNSVIFSDYLWDKTHSQFILSVFFWRQINEPQQQRQV